MISETTTSGDSYISQLMDIGYSNFDSLTVGDFSYSDTIAEGESATFVIGGPSDHIEARLYSFDVIFAVEYKSTITASVTINIEVIDTSSGDCIPLLTYCPN